MANISVTVQDGNNITLVSTPTPTQVITIDRGIAGPQGPAGDPGDPAGSQYQIQYNSGLNTFTALKCPSSPRVNVAASVPNIVWKPSPRVVAKLPNVVFE